MVMNDLSHVTIFIPYIDTHVSQSYILTPIDTNSSKKRGRNVMR